MRELPLLDRLAGVVRDDGDQGREALYLHGARAALHLRHDDAAHVVAAAQHDRLQRRRHLVLVRVQHEVPSSTPAAALCVLRDLSVHGRPRRHARQLLQLRRLRQLRVDELTQGGERTGAAEGVRLLDAAGAGNGRRAVCGGAAARSLLLRRRGRGQRGRVDDEGVALCGTVGRDGCGVPGVAGDVDGVRVGEEVPGGGALVEQAFVHSTRVVRAVVGKHDADAVGGAQQRLEGCKVVAELGDGGGGGGGGGGDGGGGAATHDGSGAEEASHCVGRRECGWGRGVGWWKERRGEWKGRCFLLNEVQIL
eukprot:Rhum_TRINITY_DN14180_c35_g1::Rhum_TRINITY_DN14180_c35_g1_i1::g.72743::m.72743